jgi:hypothetical protein
LFKFCSFAGVDEFYHQCSEIHTFKWFSQTLGVAERSRVQRRFLSESLQSRHQILIIFAITQHCFGNQPFDSVGQQPLCLSIHIQSNFATSAAAAEQPGSHVASVRVRAHSFVAAHRMHAT